MPTSPSDLRSWFWYVVLLHVFVLVTARNLILIIASRSEVQGDHAVNDYNDLTHSTIALSTDGWQSPGASSRHGHGRQFGRSVTAVLQPIAQQRKLHALTRHYLRHIRRQEQLGSEAIVFHYDATLRRVVPWFWYLLCFTYPCN